MKLHQIKSIVDEACRVKSHGHHINFIHAILLPVVLAGLGAISADLWKYSRLITGGIWLVVIVLWWCIWFRSRPSADSLLSISVELSEANEKIHALETAQQELESLARKWNFESFSASTLRSMVTQYISTDFKDVSEFNEAIDELLSPLELSGAVIFGFDGPEKWSFALYLYSKKDDILVPIWRKRSINHPGNKISRKWGRGEGHVGKAFVDGTPIITGDASVREVQQLALGPISKNKPYDNIYMSFASVPFGPIGTDSNLPYGVLVATSDTKDRYDKNSGYLLQHYADSVAMLLGLTKVNSDCIIAGCTPYSNCEGDSDEENRP